MNTLAKKHRLNILYLLKRFPFTLYGLLGLALTLWRNIQDPLYDDGLFAFVLVIGQPIWGFFHWIVRQGLVVVFDFSSVLTRDLTVCILVFIICLAFDLTFRSLFPVREEKRRGTNKPILSEKSASID